MRASGQVANGSREERPLVVPHRDRCFGAVEERDGSVDDRGGRGPHRRCCRYCSVEAVRCVVDPTGITARNVFGTWQAHWNEIELVGVKNLGGGNRVGDPSLIAAAIKGTAETRGITATLAFGGKPEASSAKLAEIRSLAPSSTEVLVDGTVGLEWYGLRPVAPSAATSAIARAAHRQRPVAVDPQLVPSHDYRTCRFMQLCTAATSGLSATKALVSGLRVGSTLPWYHAVGVVSGSRSAVHNDVGPGPRLTYGPRVSRDARTRFERAMAGGESRRRHG